MKRLVLIFGVLALALGGQAQKNQHSNYIGLNAGGGLNTLMYSPTDGKWNPGFGFLGELKYMHFFGKHFGMGFGVQFDYARANATYNFREVTTGLVHPANGLTYESRTVYNNWKESQTAMFLSVPVELYWRAPMGERWFFLFGLGAQLDLPMKGEFKADEGSYEVRGYFPATNVEYRTDLANGYDFRSYGFDTYSANEKGDIKDLKKLGVSLIADLGFNYAMSNHWGIYFGIYGGYGLTNLLDKKSSEPMLDAPSGTTTINAYNGTINSTQVDEVHLFNVGAKIGINIGWQCHSSKSAEDNGGDLVPYDNANTSNSNTPAYTSEEDEAAREAEEAAAREVRCNARRMNNPDMAAAIVNIDADIADAEQAAKESANNAAKEAVDNARSTRNAAFAAHKEGKYCRAYDLFNEAYGFLADSYASDARTYADKKNNAISSQAADDAELYAEASHKDGLDCAMAASRNAKINSEIARHSDGSERSATAYNDPNFANNFANQAIKMAKETGSKAALTDGNDASGKAYRGNLPGCYAAAAKSFAESAEACAAKSNSAEAQAAVKEAKTAATEAAETARMGNTAAAYRAALKACENAQRACGGEVASAAKPTSQVAKPVNRAELQHLLDLINATVHFEFAKTEPQFDAATARAIETLCVAMKADKSLKVLVTGHTDNVGSASGNMTYGLKRAEALKNIMVQHGAPAANISTSSKGQNEPIVDNDTDEHRYQNRRAVITLK